MRTGSAAWRGEDLAGDASWLHLRSPAAIACLDTATAHWKAQGLQFPNFTQTDFQLSEFMRAELAAHAQALENGRGFVVLHGLPVERYSEQEINAIYYGISWHLGHDMVLEPGDMQFANN